MLDSVLFIITNPHAIGGFIVGAVTAAGISFAIFKFVDSKLREVSNTLNEVLKTENERLNKSETEWRNEASNYKSRNESLVSSLGIIRCKACGGSMTFTKIEHANDGFNTPFYKFICANEICNLPLSLTEYDFTMLYKKK